MSTGFATPAARAVANPWVIAFVVSMATFMEVLDTTVANVALAYIAGDTGVSADEASWVVTTYLVANAVILTASSFLVKRLGRKPFYLGCLALFTISSVGCALSWNLPSLLFFRITQGLAGGGMVPLSQSILADSFPPEKRGQAFSLFGMAVVVAPIVGPTLGGWLSDNYGWEWCFMINAPVGIAGLALIHLILPASQPGNRETLRFDLVGFLLVAAFLGSLELMLDRGLEDDWFASGFIIAAAMICGAAFVLMIPWEFSRKDPIIDLRMVGTRQFGSCFLIMLVAGGVLLATTQILPQLVQQNFGYTATLAGLVLSPGGIVAMVMMLVVGRLTAVVPAKYLIACGTIVIALSMFNLTYIDGNTTFSYFMWSRMFTSVGLPLVFLPIITAAYDGLPPGKTDQASALMNAARNTGGSIGISLAANVQWFRSQEHQSRLVEHVVPSSIPYQETLKNLTSYFMTHGSSAAQAQQQAFAWIAQQVQTQAALMGYVDVFWVITVLAVATVPLALILRNSRPVAHAPAVH